MNRDDNALGICLGASSLGIVRMSGAELQWARSYVHEGNPRKVLVRILDEIPDLAALRVAATGRKFRRHLAFSTLSEPEAVERAVSKTLPKDHPYRIVVSAGAETFMAYHLDPAGRIQSIHTGNKCASGTGEFFLQQLGRMGSTVGVILAAVVLTVLNEFLRDFEQYRMIVFSLLLIVMMIVRPQGLLPASLFHRRTKA